ncbi:hypothetical protein PSYMO_11540 [Pseudomonas amygdali pv. mori str. 301020]|uniref:Uncharacterized protein n=1 Tax=Pseudomonas amygdali pv. mori str. 301020 TaxID=629261 RepID=A0A656G951_PSEA0|nr:hypothetical protein PSYMO_11540 [Pseudomonas amygdali pv. mori str. 301020]
MLDPALSTNVGARFLHVAFTDAWRCIAPAVADGAAPMVEF